jgi:hypothetical protein
MRFTIAATAATLLLAQAALAWNPPSDGNQAAVEPEQSTTQVQQAKVERILKGAGFTDVQVITSSFLVRAKNPADKPVMMIVDPTAMTAAVIERPQSTPDEDSTTGSADPNQNSDPVHR